MNLQIAPFSIEKFLPGKKEISVSAFDLNSVLGLQPFPAKEKKLEPRAILPFSVNGIYIPKKEVKIPNSKTIYDKNYHREELRRMIGSDELQNFGRPERQDIEVHLLRKILSDTKTARSEHVYVKGKRMKVSYAYNAATGRIELRKHAKKKRQRIPWNKLSLEEQGKKLANKARRKAEKQNKIKAEMNKRAKKRRGPSQEN